MSELDLDDAEALATWCVFWGEMPDAPRHAADAAAMIRKQHAEIERLRAALNEIGERASFDRGAGWASKRAREALGQEPTP